MTGTLFSAPQSVSADEADLADFISAVNSDVFVASGQSLQLEYELHSYSDSEKTEFKDEKVTWTSENKITVGLNDGTGRFGVGQPCTREQCVTFLYRAADKHAVKEHREFTDVTSDRYYYDAISWTAEHSITVGLNDGTNRFGVGQKCSRAMIVTFLLQIQTYGCRKVIHSSFHVSSPVSAGDVLCWHASFQNITISFKSVYIVCENTHCVLMY